MQAHYGTYTDASNVRASIKRFIDIGVKIAISELDVEVKVTTGNFGTGKNSPMTDIEQRIQALTYAQLFLMFLRNTKYVRNDASFRVGF